MSPSPRSTGSPSDGAGLTFLTQEVLAGAVNPEQGEQAREVKNALPAIPVQEERSCPADHQRPARKTTLGLMGLAASARAARINGRRFSGHQTHLKESSVPVCRHWPVTP